MAQTNVAVVSAGVKSILDIGLTLEYLETLGVPVVTFGSPDFPSFYSRKSGFAVSYTHLRAHETVLDIVCRLQLEKTKHTTKKKKKRELRRTLKTQTI